MRTLYKVAIGSVIGLAVADKLGIAERLAVRGDAEVHGKEWAAAKYRERRGLAARGLRATCERCKQETASVVMSMFSKEDICGDCKERERTYPGYREAEVQDLREFAGRLRAKGSVRQAASVEHQADALERGDLD
jgi:hypothetical protein